MNQYEIKAVQVLIMGQQYLETTQRKTTIIEELLVILTDAKL